MLTDSIIALCSTTYPQIKAFVNRAYEANIGHISASGIGLVVEAIVRHDKEYVKDDIYGVDEEGGASGGGGLIVAEDDEEDVKETASED